MRLVCAVCDFFLLFIVRPPASGRSTLSVWPSKHQKRCSLYLIYIHTTYLYIYMSIVYTLILHLSFQWGQGASEMQTTVVISTPGCIVICFGFVVFSLYTYIYTCVHMCSNSYIYICINIPMYMHISMFRSLFGISLIARHCTQSRNCWSTWSCGSSNPVLTYLFITISFYHW